MSLDLAGQFDICVVVDNDVVHDVRVRKEATSLAAQGWRVLVLGISRNGPESEIEEWVDGYAIYRIHSRFLRQRLTNKAGHILRTVEGFARAAWLLKRLNVSVYHAVNFTGLMIVALAGIWQRPVVYDSFELYFDRPLGLLTVLLNPILHPFEWYLAQRATAIIMTSDSHAQQLVKRLHVSSSPIIVRNAVDIRKLSEAPVEFDLQGPTIIAHSGWLIAGRRLEELVSALLYLPDEACVVFVGDGPRRNEVLVKARSLGLENRVTIVGKILPDQIVPTLSQATLAVVLSEPDPRTNLNQYLGLPNKFFEAVAAGIPIIASPIPEVKRLVELYDIGVICDPHDPHSIADAALEVLKPGNLERLRANVRRARDELSWEGEERKLVGMYQDILR